MAKRTSARKKAAGTAPKRKKSATKKAVRTKPARKKAGKKPTVKNVDAEAAQASAAVSTWDGTAFDADEVWEPSRVKCAKHFNIAASTLRLWMGHPAFPDCSNGHPLKAIAQWRDDYGRKGADIEDHKDDGRGEVLAATEREKLKQAEIKTKRDEMAMQLEAGELAWRRSLELAFSTFATESRDSSEVIINTLPSTAGVPKKYQAKLRQALRAAFKTQQQQIHASILAQLSALDEAQKQQTDAA